MRIALAFVMLVASGRLAAAECRAPRTVISPPSGAVLPTNPTFYVFAGDHHARSEVKVRQDEREIPIDTRVVGETEAWTVIRVRVLTDAPGPIDVLYTRGYDHDGTARYVISAQPPADEEKLYAEELVDDEWSCSFTRGVQLDLGGTATVYRLEYAADVTSLRAGHGETAYLPVRPSVRDGGEPTVIGHLSCQGWDVPPEVLALGVYVRLVAVYADGREHAEELGLLRMDDRRIRPPDWYDGFLSLDAPADAPVPDHEVRDSFDAGLGLASGAASGTAASLAVLAFAARRRRRRSTRHGRL